MKKSVSSSGDMIPSGACYQLITRFEGLKLKAYKCPAGVWTIGYGHTKNVHSRLTITKVEALVFLKSDVLSVAALVTALIKPKISQNQFDALVSFTFNVGAYNFSESTLLKKLNMGTPISAIAAEFGRWVYSKDIILTGLIRRREAERELFLKG